MNKKGFTLIELLAVIVILAIIALIVTPVVSGIVTNAKKAANARSVEGHIKNVEYAIISKAFGVAGSTDSITAYDSATTEAGLSTLEVSDGITCASYAISNGTVTTATGCGASWGYTFGYTAANGAVVESN